MDLSYCIVNTAGREHLMRCLASIQAADPASVESEVLVLDNASGDGSAEAVEEWNAGPDGFGERLRVIALERRTGKAENDSTLLREARGDWCLLLNEDSELRLGSVDTLLETATTRDDAAAVGAQLLGPDGSRSACAWKLPTVDTTLAQVLFLHRIFVTQSGGDEVREVGWVQSAAMLVRRSAASAVGYLDPDFFVYSDETDFQKRLHDAGWKILHVPGALAIHHEQLTTDRSESAHRRAVEFHRNRDLYMRKHHGSFAAGIVRALTAFNYGTRALIAILRPGQDAGHFWQHAKLAWKPRGEGIREAAAAYNARLDQDEVASA